MAILKICRDSKTLKDMFDYINREDAVKPYFLMGTFHASRKHILQCMKIDKMIWYQNYGIQYRQIIMALDPILDPHISNHHSPQENRQILSHVYGAMYRVGELLAYYHGGRYYTAFAIHVVDKEKDGQTLHAHFIMDSIDWSNGKRLFIDKQGIALLRQEVDGILSQYGLSCIKKRGE